jgi:hypothetical protein
MIHTSVSVNSASIKQEHPGHRSENHVAQRLEALASWDGLAAAIRSREITTFGAQLPEKERVTMA